VTVVETETLQGVLPRFKAAVGEWLIEQSRSGRFNAPLARKACRMLWRRAPRPSQFALSYLEGLSGIEIGAGAHNDYGLNVINVDRYGMLDTIYKDEEWRLTGRRRTVDIVAPGEHLPFEDNAADFVFASHVLEHFPEPIRALEGCLRDAGKVVVLVIAHRDRTFDRDRELTPATELLHRHEEGFEDPRDLLGRSGRSRASSSSASWCSSAASTRWVLMTRLAKASWWCSTRPLTLASEP
jgi:SAM-dependent methyltransferase